MNKLLQMCSPRALPGARRGEVSTVIVASRNLAHASRDVIGRSTRKNMQP